MAGSARVGRLLLLWSLVFFAPLLRPHLATALAAGKAMNWARVYAKEAHQAIIENSPQSSRSVSLRSRQNGSHARRLRRLAPWVQIGSRVGIDAEGRSAADLLRASGGGHTRSHVSITASGDPCITGWTCTDVDNATPTGSATDNGGGSWTLSGGGSAGIYGTYDQFFYMWKSVTATTTISARIASFTQAPGGSQAGIMLRQSTDQSAPYYCVFVIPGSGVYVRYRLYQGATHTQITGPAGGSVPIYLRIQRSGFTFTAYTSGDGTTYTAIAGSTLVINMAPTTAGLELDGGGVNPAIATFDSVSVSTSGNDATPGCASGWSCADIGSTGAVGGESWVNQQTFAVSGAGYVNASADAFHYDWQTLAASGTISAQVMSLAATQSGTQAGLMMRQSTSPGSPYYFAYESTDGKVYVKYRPVQGYTGIIAVSTPTSGNPFIEVARTGVTFRTYTSTDGQSWTELAGAAVPVPMNGSVLVGMAVGSSWGGSLSTAEFDSVSLTPTDQTGIDHCAGGWTCQDIGTAGWAGDQSSVGGASWAVAGGGDDIGGTIDLFHYVYQSAGALGTVSARVFWHHNDGYSYTKAGVMLRKSIDREDLYYYAFVDQNNNINVQWRDTYGKYPNGISSPITATLPVYLKVQQAGDSFTASYKTSDGGGWQAVPGSNATVKIGAALGGLAVTAGNNGTIGTAGFDHVNLVRGGPGSSDVGSLSENIVTCPGGDPVDCATGIFSESFGDLAIPGRGIALSLSHTYRSANAGQNGPLGYGWTDSYNLYLTTDMNGDIAVHEETGTAVTFIQDGSGYVGPSRVLASLVSNGDGTFTFTRYRTQEKFVFSAPTLSAAGMLLRQTDLNGYTTTLSYANGALSSVTDAEGRSLTFSYNTSGRLASVTDPASRSVSFSYDTSGNLTDVIDIGGGHSHFTYDTNHLLLTMQSPRQYPVGSVTTNVYDANGRVTLQTDPLNRVTRISYTANSDGTQTTTVTSPTGNVSTQLYSSDNLLQSLTLGSGTPQAATWSFQYDPTTLGVTQATDPNGHTVKRQWDAQGNLLQTTDGVLRTMKYTYNALNELLSVQDPENILTQLQYDASGNLLTVARPLTGSTYTGMSPYQTSVLSHSPYLYWTFDELPGATTAADASGNGRTGTYQAGATLGQPGNLPYGNDYSITVNGTGVTSSAIMPSGGSARSVEWWWKGTTQSNGAGAMLGWGSTAGNGLFDLQVYSGYILIHGWGSGNDAPTNTLNAPNDLDGNWHHYALIYDGTTFTLVYDGTVQGTWSHTYNTVATGLRVGAGYDGTGVAGTINEVAVFNTALTVAQVQADYNAAIGNGPVSGPGTVTSTCSSSPPSGTAVVSLCYDDSSHPGDVSRVVDPNGHASSFAYSTNGDLIKVTDAAGDITTSSFDAVGRPLTEVSPKGNVTGGNPSQYTTTLATNAFGDVTSVTDPLQHQTVYGYDAERNLTSIKDPRLNTTSYTFDADNELSGIGYADGTSRGFAYDPDGNVLSQANGLNQTTSYTYDPLDRAITMTDPLLRKFTYGHDGAGNVTSLQDALSRTTSYGYDAANQLRSISYNDGTTPKASFTYSGNGERAGMIDGTGTSSYGYDSLNRLIQSANGAGQALAYGYDLTGNLTSLTYPGNLQVTRSYDAANRLTGVSDWLQHTISFGYDANSSLVSQSYPNTTAASFANDAADQLTGITDSKGGIPFWSFGYGRDANGQLSSSTDPVENANHTYGYDTLNRLSSDLKGTAPTAYTYDPADELKTITNTVATSTSTFSYDTADELTSLQKIVGTSTIQNLTLSYNANGDRTGQTDSISGNQVTYGYDQADRLTRWVSGSTTAQYSHDGDGLRQSKTVGSTTTNQLWDVAEGMPLLVQDGSTRYITGLGGLPIEQVDGSGNVLYYYQDQLGSTRGLLDGSGNTQATYTFDPYGNVAAKTGSASTPFQYAGQYTDSESGLQYLRARYYDPLTAQFLTVDPLAGTTIDPYAYTVNDPLNIVDPAGTCPTNAKSEPIIWGPVNIGKCNAEITGPGPTEGTGPPHYSLRIFKGRTQSPDKEIFNYHIYFAGGTPPGLMWWRVEVWIERNQRRRYEGRAGSNATQQSIVAATKMANAVPLDIQKDCGKTNIRRLLLQKTTQYGIGVLPNTFFSVYSIKTGNGVVEPGWCPLPPPFHCD